MTKEDAPYAERRIAADDGLLLYCRDYDRATGDRLPVVCLTGLTRNSKDFATVADRLSARRRVICPDWRGRGRSAYDPTWANYQPPTYIRDLLGMLTALGISRCVVIGTSLGGMVGTALATVQPTLLAGLVINDVGPEIPTEGVARIASYVGQDQRFPTLEAAVAGVQAILGRALPDLPPETWLRIADSTFTRDAAANNWRLDYDLNLGQALAVQIKTAPPDLWALFGALENIPTLLVHGALSDVLKSETVARMKQAKPDLDVVTLPNRGHAPLLEEPECETAIDRLLERLDA